MSLQRCRSDVVFRRNSWSLRLWLVSGVFELVLVGVMGVLVVGGVCALRLRGFCYVSPSALMSLFSHQVMVLAKTSGI